MGESGEHLRRLKATPNGKLQEVNSGGAYFDLKACLEWIKHTFIP